MDSRAAWLRELEHPTEGFFRAFAGRICEPEGLRGAAREAVIHLTPRVDWEGHLPQMPHGLLGLRAALRLKEHLSEARFLRLVATQLFAMAQEPRAPRGLQALGLGSGHWPNLEMALRDHHPAIAWGEAMGLEAPGSGDFARILPFVAGDMANVGHKAVMVHQLQDLFGLLDEPRPLVGLAAWVAATEPSDRFWNARVHRRLEGFNVRVAPGEARLGPEEHRAGAREICEMGLVAMLDAFTTRMKSGMNQGDLLTILILAASEKQWDARRDLEGKTSWTFVYLALLPWLEDPEPWGQGAALVNFFPSEEAEERLEPQMPSCETVGRETPDPAAGLLDAILDGEPALAMGLVPCLKGDLGVLRVLAEAAALNDPGFDHSHQILALAAAAELLPRITEPARDAMLQALAKALADSQGGGELGHRADRALKRG